jgi:hypothetical protein
MLRDVQDSRECDECDGDERSGCFDVATSESRSARRVAVRSWQLMI